MWIQRGGCAIRSRVGHVFQYRGFCAGARSSREGFCLQTPEERAWDRRGRVVWWELLDKSRIPGGHNWISHVWTVPRVMQICSRTRVSLTNIAKVSVVTSGIRASERETVSESKKRISWFFDTTCTIQVNGQSTNIDVQLIDARSIGRIKEGDDFITSAFR